MTIFYERTEEWGRVGVEGESCVDFMGGFGWGGQRTISSRRGSLLKFVGGVSSEVGDQDGRCTGGSVSEKVLLEEQELQEGKTLMIQVMDFV